MRAWASILVLVLACGDDGGDESRLDGGSCTESSDCDDGLFCNGEESCAGGSCAAGTPPCDGACDEDGDVCGEGCVDADGDGATSMACGGTDCDDSDPGRFPGNTEVCDADDVDEDCDPTTYGRRDIDGDDVTDANCCNGDNCGEDCDDNRAGVNPTATETCNGLDDDCDGNADEEVGSVYTIDMDGDGFGAIGGDTVIACLQPDGYAEDTGDCDDSETGVNPGVGESCDAAGVDENCDGITNPASLCDCSAGDPPRPCEREGVCANGNEMCVAGMWDMCSISPTTETCNGLDDDCNGAVDDGFLCADGSTQACNVCGQVGVRACRPGCAGFGACEATEACNDCDDDSDGVIDEDFDCRIGSTVACTNACGNPAQATCGASCTVSGGCTTIEVCDYCDDDGDGTSDDETPLATVDTSAVGAVCGDFQTGGDASCSGSVSSSSTTVLSPGDDLGGVWLDEEVRLGYRPVDFEFRVSFETSFTAGANPSASMAYILSTARPRSGRLVGTTANGGAPSERSVFAVHDFHPGGATDRIRIMQSTGLATTEVIACNIASATFRVDQGEIVTMRVRLRYVPANSVLGTASSLALYACNASTNANCTPSTLLGCQGSVMAFPVDTPLYGGITGAASRHAPFAVVDTDGLEIVADGRCE